MRSTGCPYAQWLRMSAQHSCQKRRSILGWMKLLISESMKCGPTSKLTITSQRKAKSLRFAQDTLLGL
ncbi:hypothetical protein ACET8V_10450 [Aeromonas veronii]